MELCMLAPDARETQLVGWKAGHGLGLGDVVKELERLCVPCVPCVMARTEQSRRRHNTTTDRSS